MTLKVAVAIATAGRRETLTSSLTFIKQQSLLPDELLICPAKKTDFDPAALSGYLNRYVIIDGVMGLPKQRNLLLKAVSADIVVFFDDDFLPCKDYLEKVVSIFTLNPEIVIATGKLIADGIHGPGITHKEGEKLLEYRLEKSNWIKETYNGYGCNMAVRLKPVRENSINFDESLPLYAWLEDLDFSRQLASYGSIVQVGSLSGVHLGTKGSSRSSGRRLGYSQIANPIYLFRKGTMSWKLARKHMLNNLTANLVFSVKPEPWIDRRGRLYGNIRALYDFVLRRMRPDNILDL